MELIISNAEVLHSQIPFGQVRNFVSQPQVFPKKSLYQTPDTEISLCMFSFSDFNNVLEFEIEDIEWNDFSDRIIFQLNYRNKLRFKLKLDGFWELQNERNFKPNSFEVIIDVGREVPISAFIIYTLETMLFLSSGIKIDFPHFNYWIKGSFQQPLNRVSETLQIRQLAYRLMGIEKALNINLPLPLRAIIPKERQNIAFCYYAIVDKRFDWPSYQATIPRIASKVSLAWLPESNIPNPFTFQPEFFVKDIFGILVNLGLMTATIEQAVIDNYYVANEKLSKLDGSVVDVKLRSLNGVSKMISVNVPELPAKAWDNETQQFIDLGEKFDSIFLERYFNLAAATLEGLTEEQKKSITERPTLDEEAFE